MKLTDAAAKAVLGVMKSKGMDPNKWFFEIGVFNGALGISFTREQKGKLAKFGGLNVIINHNVDSTGVIVDFGEINGKRGLIFLGEEHVK